MRELRSAGARGLAGLFARSGVARPLLGSRRSEIVCYAAENRVEWLEDPSNSSLRFLRNRVRHELLPAMRAVRPSIETDLLAVARAAAHWRLSVDAVAKPLVATEPAGSTTRLDLDAAALRRQSPEGLRILLPA